MPGRLPIPGRLSMPGRLPMPAGCPTYAGSIADAGLSAHTGSIADAGLSTYTGPIADAGLSTYTRSIADAGLSAARPDDCPDQDRREALKGARRRGLLPVGRHHPRACWEESKGARPLRRPSRAAEPVWGC